MREENNGESNWRDFDNPFAKELLVNYENQFYKNFEFLMDEPNDPFLSMRDFKKKSTEDSME